MSFYLMSSLASHHLANYSYILFSNSLSSSIFHHCLFIFQLLKFLVALSDRLWIVGLISTVPLGSLCFHQVKDWDTCCWSGRCYLLDLLGFVFSFMFCLILIFSCLGCTLMKQTNILGLGFRIDCFESLLCHPAISRATTWTTIGCCSQIGNSRTRLAYKVITNLSKSLSYCNYNMQ